MDRSSLVVLLLTFVVLCCYSSASIGVSASSGFSKVTFAEPIANVTVAVGRDAVLSCVVDNLGSHRVAWVHLDRQMILTIHRQVVTRVGRFSVSYDHQRTWHLHIRGVQPEDAGSYMCQVNSEPMISQVGHVHVVVPPSIVDADSSPSQLSVREGVRVSLVCRARGVPSARVTWKREDGRVLVDTKQPSSALQLANNNESVASGSGAANNKRTKSPTAAGRVVTIAQDGEELIIPKVSRTDSAAYLCIASNGVPPSVSKRIILDVEFEPLMVVPNQLIGSPVGGSVTLECLTEAQPRPITYWIRTDANNLNGVMLLPSKRYKLLAQHTGYQTHMTLHIHHVEPQDIGHYKCVSKNSLGEAEGSIRIYEMMATPSKPIDSRASYQQPGTATTTSTGSSQLAFPPAVNDDEEAGLSEELLEDGGEDETGGDARRRSHDKVYGDQTAPNRKLDNGRSRSKGSTLSDGLWGIPLAVALAALLNGC